MKKVIIDIETAGCEFDALDEISKEYLLKYAENDEQIQEAKESMSFSPLTAQVVAIGMADADAELNIVYYQNPEGEEREEDGVEYIGFKSEKELLASFWEKALAYQQFITFNGRGFDCPFLAIRSAINKVKPSKNLMPNRYSSDLHIDLLDRLTFFGSVRRKFSLHMWCKAFGIASPKEGEVTGYQVKDLFREGKYLDIARYCLGDIIATKELFLYWDAYVK